MPRTPLLPLLTGILIGILTQCTEQVREAVALPTQDFQVGDIVFRRGESVASRMVLMNDPDGEYSHVGMIIQGDSSLMVVHALPGTVPTQDGEDLIRLETLHEFFAPENAIYGKVMRLPLDTLQQAELTQRARTKVVMRTEFDHDYDNLDTTRLYCTELLQLLYQHIGIDLAEGRITSINIPGVNADIIMPADIHRNEKLKTIFIF